MLWLGIVILETIHHVLAAVTLRADPAQLVAALKAQMGDAAAGATDAASNGSGGAGNAMANALGSLDDAALTQAAELAPILMAVVGIAFVMLVGSASLPLLRRSPRAPRARLVLLIFSTYFAVRGLTAAFALPTGSAPLALYAADGVTQILVGVAAAMSLIFVYREETLAWTGEKRP